MFTELTKVMDKFRPRPSDGTKNPNVLILHVKLSAEFEPVSLRIDGSHQITITSSDHSDVKEAHLVLDYPTLTGFKMEIEYNELVIGLQIKTFTSWSFEESIPSVLYKLNKHDIVALQPGMVV